MAAPLPKNAWDETEQRKPFQREVWMVDAACAGHPDSHIFFPNVGTSCTLVLQARKVCSTCPVWNKCLRFAIQNHENCGIWGGLSYRERQALRKSGRVRHCSRCKLIGIFSGGDLTTCDVCKNINSRRRKPLG